MNANRRYANRTTRNKKAEVSFEGLGPLKSDFKISELAIIPFRRLARNKDIVRERERERQRERERDRERDREREREIVEISFRQ